MRINQVGLTQALVKTQATAIQPVPKVVAGQAMVQTARVESARVESEPGSPTRRSGKKRKQRKSSRLNWDGLGGEVDIFA